MLFKDNFDMKPQPRGEFGIYSYNKNNELIDAYEEKNLIVYGARSVMAKVLGAFTEDVTGACGMLNPINRLVLGTRGHIGNDILTPVLVGEMHPDLGLFSPERDELYSEQTKENNYHITFDPAGALEVFDDEIPGTMYNNGIAGTEDVALNSAKREITGDFGNVVRYTITIDQNCGNLPGVPVTYTEAALYAGDTMFAMKTFPARVKEDTVKFVIIWSVIF